MRDLTGFQRDLLFVVAGLEEPNGVEIKGTLEEYYGTEVRHGRLYPNLDELVDLGLVNKGQKDRRTNEYSLTDDGRQMLVDKIRWQSKQAVANDINIPQRAAD